MPLLTYLKNIKQYILAAIGSLLICISFTFLPLGHSLMLASISCISLSLVGGNIILPNLVKGYA